MQKIKVTITILFENPFWIAVCEKETNNTLQAIKITFGAEPKDYQVYTYLMAHWYRLSFSIPLPIESKPVAKINPKRMHRLIQKQLQNTSTSTKSQMALKQQQEEHKQNRKQKHKEQKEAEKQQKYLLRQAKRKKKHKGN